MNNYCTLNDVKAMLATSGTLAADASMDAALFRLIGQSSRMIDKYCERYFYIWEGIRYYDGHAIRVILDDDLQSATEVALSPSGDGLYPTTYDLTSTPPDAFLYPLNITPKTRLEICPWGKVGHFGAGLRKAIRITGVFGYGNDYPAAYLEDSGIVLTTGGMDASTTTLNLASGAVSNFSLGMTLRVDTEQMFLSSQSGNSLIVQRGVNGTTAAAHLVSAEIYYYLYPGAIVQAAVTQTLRAWERRKSAYMTVEGNPVTGMVTVYKGLDPDIAETIKEYKRERYPSYIT